VPAGAQLKSTVVLKTIRVQTTILHNTTIPIDPGLTLTVDNAPTHVDLITSYFSGRITSRSGRYLYVYLLSTDPINSSQAAARNAAPAPGPFLLTIQSSKIAGKQRRQAASFVDYKGRATSNCLQASTYTIFQGQLFAQYANGTTAQFSAYTGDLYTILEPRTEVGDIRTAFSLSNTGSLLWNNDAFFNGGALFCILPSGDLVAVFVQGAQPESCVFIDLTVSLCKHRYIGGLSYLMKRI
jgi:hypothetical protein